LEGKAIDAFFAQGCLGKASWKCFERNQRLNFVAEVQGGAGGFDRFYCETSKRNENVGF